MVDLDPAASAMPGSGEKSLAQPSGGRRRGRPKGSGNKAAQCERRASLPARLASRRRQALGAWAGEIDKGIAAPRRVGCKSLVFNSVATIPAGHRPPMHLNERAMFRRHARHAEVGCSRLRQIIIGPSRKHPTWTARDLFPGPRRPSRFAAWSRALPEPQNLVALRTGGAAFVGGVKIDKGAPAFRRVCCKSPVFNSPTSLVGWAKSPAPAITFTQFRARFCPRGEPSRDRTAWALRPTRSPDGGTALCGPAIRGQRWCVWRGRPRISLTLHPGYAQRMPPSPTPNSIAP